MAGHLECRIIVRDITGKYVWDSAILHGLQCERECHSNLFPAILIIKWVVNMRTLTRVWCLWKMKIPGIDYLIIANDVIVQFSENISFTNSIVNNSPVVKLLL